MSSHRFWQERKETFFRYYKKSPLFALIDLTFGFLALFLNPYRTCRKFLQKRGEASIYAYGETPYTTYERIAEQCGICSEDVWMELGAGRGKGCFWMAHFRGCRVIGLEWIPSFVRIAKAIQFLFRKKKLSFELRDLHQADLTRATYLYLYGIWPSTPIPPHVKVISISEPLAGHKVLKSFWVRFPWGRTTAYLSEKES